MHRLSTSFVLGFHGCDEVVAEAVLAGKAFTPSQNRYDWLGSGMYSWETNLSVALMSQKQLRLRFGEPKGAPNRF